MKRVAIYAFGVIPALFAWVVFFILGAIFVATKSPYVRRLALSFDQLANAFLNGDEDETPSSRMGRALMKGNKGLLRWRYHLCKFLSWIDPFSENHCEESIGE